MTSVLFTLMVLALIGAMVYAGYRDGAFFTAYALLRNLMAFLCAMTLFQPLARVATRLISDAPPAYQYFMPACFALVWASVFVAGRALKVAYTTPQVPFHPLVDRGVGPVLGLLNAVVVSGTILVAWSLFPFVKFVPGDLGHAGPSIDTGAAMVRFYGFVEEQMGGNTDFLVHQEPLEVDVNENGRWDATVAGESYKDLNLNGRWDRGWLWRYEHHASIAPEDFREAAPPPEAPPPPQPPAS